MLIGGKGMDLGIKWVKENSQLHHLFDQFADVIAEPFSTFCQPEFS